MKREVIIVGGGVAGIQTALRLADRGIRPTIVEKEPDLGGKLRGWYHLFPLLTPASEVLSELRRRLAARDVEVMTSAEAVSITPGSVTLADGRILECGSVVVCSGFTLFDARLKEEYGYGVYDNVFTSADIERMLNEGNVTTSSGRRPRRIALLHCVGSRDEKVCQAHCSRVCCITGVKQAMELKRLFPDADVFNFYMDIRMFGPGYEEMYREAQQNYNIHFVRGRISEASDLRRPVADQGRRYPDGASFADERRYAGAARRDAGERFERRFRGFGRVEAGAQRLHGTAGPLLEQRPQRCGRDLLRRYGHRAEEYRRNIERGRCGSGSPDGLSGEGIVMAAINWGYAINKPRVIDIDSNNLRKSDEILREMPELQTCIGCGGCTATCTAGNLTDFNFRKLHTLVRRGEYQGVYEQMNKCMLCGKCRLVCPRGINTRAVVMLIKRKLGDF